MSAQANGGTSESEAEQYPCVKEYTFYDSGSDYYMEGGVYWDADEEKWETVHAPEGMSTSWELVEAPEDIQEKWGRRNTAKQAAREKFKSLYDSIRHGSECPVCGGERHRVRDPPEAIADKKSLRYCGDCGSNTYYGEGMIGNFWVGIGNGINWNTGGWEHQISLSDGTGRNCATRYKRGPDYYGEKIKTFKKELRELRSEVR